MRIARLVMVMSSMSPLFMLWAIKGNGLVPPRYFLAACFILVVAPNVFLWWRIRVAYKLHEVREILVGSAEDHREHLLVYLFAMLLPFYQTPVSDWRGLGATVAALGFVVFLFWHLNLHYMNMVFALLGYRVFTVYPSKNANPFSGRGSVVLITRSVTMLPGDRLTAYRISDTVYFEGED